MTLALPLDDYGASVGAWTSLVRRARLGPSRKAAALVVGSYANHDGTSIYCGGARLAVDLECSLATAKRHLTWLREVGLIERVRRANRRRGYADEYRLTFGPHLLEHIKLPSPTEYDALVQAVKADADLWRTPRAPVDNPAQLGVKLVTPNVGDPDPIRCHLGDT